MNRLLSTFDDFQFGCFSGCSTAHALTSHFMMSAMHAISSYRGNRPTNKHTNPQTNKQTGTIKLHKQGLFNLNVNWPHFQKRSI